jgi:hypothetical protein
MPTESHKLCQLNDPAVELTQVFEISGPGPLSPELGSALIAAAMTALLIEQDLEMISQRRPGRPSG